MKNAIALTQQDFQSSSSRTPEYLKWHRTFKREFTKFLESKGMTGIAFSKPNHFDLSGFFKDGSKDQIWYFSVSDVRWSKESMLIRTAKHYKDFTGGANQYIPLTNTDETFATYFDAISTAERWKPKTTTPGDLSNDINAAQIRYQVSVSNPK